jgi:hypothetical protein
MGKRHVAAVPSLLWWASSDEHVSHVATMGARGTGVVATSPHNSDGPSNISGLLRLVPKVVMGFPTSAIHYYCGSMWHGCSYY